MIVNVERCQKFAFQIIPRGDRDIPRTGKLFGQGRQESCTNEERKRTALEQKGKLAYLGRPPPGMGKNSSIREAGMTSPSYLRKFLFGGMAGGTLARSDASYRLDRQTKKCCTEQGNRNS